MHTATSAFQDIRSFARRTEICGIHFDLIGRDHVVEQLRSWRRTGNRGHVTFVNPYSVYLCKHDPEMDWAVRNAHLTLPDGIGIIAGANLLRHPNSGRLSGPEMMLHICDIGRQFGFTHYFLGGAEGVAERLAGRLQAMYPGLSIAGWHSPPFRDLTPEEDEQLVAHINSFHPNLIWVGLGAPKQEKWIALHLHRIDTVAMLGVGAAFDFHSGNVPWCPARARELGFEWAFRLAHQPRKLWPRYLAFPPFFAGLMKQFFRERSFLRNNEPSGGRDDAASRRP